MNPPTQPPIQPIYTREQMERIISRQPSITSEEFFRNVEVHLGKSLLPARKLAFVNGQRAWVSC